MSPFPELEIRKEGTNVAIGRHEHILENCNVRLAVFKAYFRGVKRRLAIVREVKKIKDGRHNLCIAMAEGASQDKMSNF